jgi:hypothetical protein
MNKESRVERIKSFSIPIQYALGLDRWEINIQCQEMDDAWGGCSIQAENFKASIGVDYDTLEDEDQLLSTLRHEFFHIMHYQYETYRKVCIACMCDSEAKITDVSYADACEKLVSTMEMAFDRLGMTPEKLVQIGKGMMEREQVSKSGIS